jgi:hypothetical protein
MTQNINLHQGTRRRRIWVTRGGALLIALLAAGSLAALFELERTRQAQLRAASDDAEHAVARLEKQLGTSPHGAERVLEELKRTEVEVASLESVAAHLNSGLLGRTTGFTAPLRALATGHTEGVWLTGVWFDNAGAQLAIEGKAFDAARVPVLLERLRRMPQFSGTAIATLDLKPAEEAGKQAPATLVRFRIATPTVDPATGAVAAGANK